MRFQDIFFPIPESSTCSIWMGRTPSAYLLRCTHKWTKITPPPHFGARVLGPPHLALNICLSGVVGGGGRAAVPRQAAVLYTSPICRIKYKYPVVQKKYLNDASPEMNVKKPINRWNFLGRSSSVFLTILPIPISPHIDIGTCTGWQWVA